MNAKTAIKMGMATLGFALVHSALASRRAKQAAKNRLGTETYEHGYRLFYTLQSGMTFLMLLRYGAGLPSTTMYRVKGPAACLLRCGQVAGMLHLYRAASEVGIARLAGLTNLHAGLCGKPALPAPLAQGPEIDASGRLTTGGLFAWSRHPLNFSGLPIFWLTPHMTDKRFIFNLVSTVYFILGSAHEAARLRSGYGRLYRQYEKSGAPFYLPRMPGSMAAPSCPGQVRRESAGQGSDV